MDDNVSRITNLLRDLILEFIPENTPKNAVANYHSFFLRLLTSRLTSKAVEDENEIRSGLQKSLQKRAEEQKLSKETVNVMSLRLQELLQALAKRKTLKKRMLVCHIIYRVSTDDKQVSILPSMDPFSKSQSSEKWKANNDTTIKKGATGMEIENSMASTTIGRSAMVSRTETRPNTTLKLIDKIANKGNPTMNISENNLLRDVLFAFQGIDGNYVYYTPHEDGFVVKPSVVLPEPVKKILSQLCEMGWMYKKIMGFIGEANLKPRGLVHQSLCHALKEELNEYYRLIAVLENLRETDDNQSKSSFLVEDQTGSKALNLRKLYLWSLEPFERLKWMCIFCDACRNAKGSTIISTIYGYAKQGSPAVQILINRVLKQVLVPFSNFLRQWVYHGELNEQYSEFFININLEAKDDNLWHEKYTLVPEMVPGFMDLQLAQKILTTGKSVNFMRRCCGVNDWILNIDFIDLNSALISNVNQTLNFTGFRDWVLAANEITSKVLLKVLFDKFKLLQHFETIKRFLLFGQGDFIQYLMDLLIKELSHPATSIYRHNLVSLLETAIRSSNAQYIDNNLLNRVDVKLMDPSPGDSGWDIFSLTYKIESPLTTIFNPKVMNGYLRLFNFLWRIKRIEHSLNSIWVQHMKGAYLMDRMREFKNHIHKCNMLRSEMIHFVGNLFGYLMIEVIESSWKVFMDELQEAKDLDEIIKYHEKFVNSMLEKALLTSKSDKIYKQMAKLFDFIFRFKCTQEILMTSIQEEEHRKAAERNKQEMMEILGGEEDLTDSIQLEHDRPINENFGQNIAREAMRAETLNSLRTVWKDYKSAFTEFMELVRDDSLGGRLRFLSFKLDFNEYYSSINPRNLEVKERDLEAFRISKNSTQQQLGGYEFATNTLRNRTEQRISPPKFDKSDAMLTENIGEDYRNKIVQPTNFNTSPPKQSNLNNILGLGDIDVGTKYEPGNLSNIHQSVDRLALLLKSRVNPAPEMRPSEGGEPASFRLEGTEQDSFLLSYNYGNKQDPNSSILRNFNYAQPEDRK